MTTQIQIENKTGEVEVQEFGNIKAGFTLGGSLNFYHGSIDSNKSKRKLTLEALGILESSILLDIEVEHKAKILIDESGACDAIISTKGNPVTLNPADCLGLIYINEAENIFGICHSGRAGIGLSLPYKFMKQFLDLSKGSPAIKIIIPPLIHAKNYPHSTDDFAKGNWWEENPEFYVDADSDMFYPELGGAAKKQIELAFSEYRHANFQIIDLGENSYTSNYYSHKKQSEDFESGHIK